MGILDWFSFFPVFPFFFFFSLFPLSSWACLDIPLFLSFLSPHGLSFVHSIPSPFAPTSWAFLPYVQYWFSTSSTPCLHGLLYNFLSSWSLLSSPLSNTPIMGPLSSNSLVWSHAVSAPHGLAIDSPYLALSSTSFGIMGPPPQSPLHYSIDFPPLPLILLFAFLCHFLSSFPSWAHLKL